MRLLAKIAGYSLLMDGIPNSIRSGPWVNFWTEFYNRYCAGYFPESYKGVMEEYRHLSPTFLRLLGMSEIFYGLIILSLARDAKR